jgi:hypothetical protein
MKMKSTINLNKAVFKGRAYFAFFSLVLAALTLTVVISVFLPGGPDRTFIYVLFLVGIPALYLMVSLAYYKFWLMEDRIVIKYPFRFKNRFRTMLLSDVDHIVYMNKLGQNELASKVIIHAKPNATWKRYELGFDDRRNKNVFVFLNIMYTRGFEIDISKCVRESLVEDQIALGIQNDEKLMRVHY